MTWHEFAIVRGGEERLGKIIPAMLDLAVTEIELAGMKGCELLPMVFGTNLDIGAKANSDYQKRTLRPPDYINQTETTYIFCTPRNWASKNAWGYQKHQVEK